MTIKLPKYPPLEFRQYTVGERIPEQGTTVDVWRTANRNQRETALVVLTERMGILSVFWKETDRAKQKEAAKSDHWRPRREDFFKIENQDGKRN